MNNYRINYEFRHLSNMRTSGLMSKELAQEMYDRLKADRLCTWAQLLCRDSDPEYYGEEFIVSEFCRD